MSKLRLRTLEINNFKVFEDFKESFNKDLIVLDGPNGFGKTSIFDALQLLLCGNIPRIVSLSNAIKINKTKQYERNLYWNNKENSCIRIKAEFYFENKTYFLMRMANEKDLKNNKYHKPHSFEIFKLYELTDFDNIDNATLIENEEEFIKNIFGNDFLNNFSVLNYISQDNNSVIIPDTNNDKRSRFDQISHLIKLDKINNKLDNLNQFNKSRKDRLKSLSEVISSTNDDLNLIKDSIVDNNASVKYSKITNTSNTPQWDKESPIVNIKHEDYKKLLDETDKLKNIIIHASEIELRINNNQYDDLVNKPDFDLAILLGPHFGKHNDLEKKSNTLTSYKSEIKVIKKNEAEITTEEIEHLSLPEKISLTKIKDTITQRIALKSTTDNYITDLADIEQLRISLTEKHLNDDAECLLCGFDYKSNQLLSNALKLKSESIELIIENHNNSYKECLGLLKSLLQSEKNILNKKVTELEKDINFPLFKDLEKHKPKKDSIDSIASSLLNLGVIIPDIHSLSEDERSTSTREIKVHILSLRKIENDILRSGDFDFYKEHFNSIEKLRAITLTEAINKKSYVTFSYNLKINSDFNDKTTTFNTYKRQEKSLELLGINLENTINAINNVKNSYSSQTLGQVESLFHIYSGRLIQNYQRGLGLFIDTEESSKKKEKNLHFFTADGSTYDAVLSMSSGQIAALTLAFFLSLNRKYANTAFILIDDPTQCMDEINIASLSDLLRIELRDRQVIISTHEQEISDYLRYRYLRGGLKADSIHLQKRYIKTLARD